MASPTNRRRRRIIPSTEEFWVFLDFRCANLERLETLLRAHEKRNSFLDRPPDAVLDVTVDAENDATTVVELPGTMIDRYKLVHEIGHGGMGVVYMAVQKEPVKRKVALKIIKPGMDTREVVARFEAERQALALMDHQSIAHVLDGGSTESGRPYFVMELVDGTPITEYCDQCRYTTRQRLELFIEQHTEPVTAPTTDEAVATTSAVDEAIGELDLDVLTDQLLDDLALAVL